MDHQATYRQHATAPYGQSYAETVERFADGFLRDRVCVSIDGAFCKAVEVVEKLVPALKVRGQ